MTNIEYSHNGQIVPIPQGVINQVSLALQRVGDQHQKALEQLNQKYMVVSNHIDQLSNRLIQIATVNDDIVTVERWIDLTERMMNLFREQQGGWLFEVIEAIEKVQDIAIGNIKDSLDLLIETQWKFFENQANLQDIMLTRLEAFQTAQAEMARFDQEKEMEKIQQIHEIEQQKLTDRQDHLEKILGLYTKAHVQELAVAQKLVQGSRRKIKIQAVAPSINWKAHTVIPGKVTCGEIRIAPLRPHKHYSK